MKELPWVVTINDGFCTWKFDFIDKRNKEDHSIMDIVKVIMKNTNLRLVKQTFCRPLKSKEAVATVKQQAKGCRKAKLPKR